MKRFIILLTILLLWHMALPATADAVEQTSTASTPKQSADPAADPGTPGFPGVRKAIGATKRDVMLHFLIESVAMSVTGGLIGIAVGLAAEYLINAYGTLPTVVSLNAIMMGFLFAAFVGISFGMYPAWKAANQNTIDALRYE